MSGKIIPFRPRAEQRDPESITEEEKEQARRNGGWVLSPYGQRTLRRRKQEMIEALVRDYLRHHPPPDETEPDHAQ